MIRISMKLVPSIGIAMVLLGVLLILSSFAWNQVVPRDALWTEQQAEEYQRIAYEYHQQTFDKSIDKITLSKTKAQYDAQRDKYDRARLSQIKIPFYLRATGVGTLIVGVSMIYAAQSQGR